VILLPALALSLTMLAFNFLGDALRDALDPRLRAQCVPLGILANFSPASLEYSVLVAQERDCTQKTYRNRHHAG
jgi:hypothetical protein